MKYIFIALAAASVLSFSQNSFAACTPIPMNPICDYALSDNMAHALCLRNAAPVYIQLGAGQILQSGHIIFAGGMNSDPNRSRTTIQDRVFIYNSQSKSLCETVHMVKARNQAYRLIELADGKVLVAGGWTDNTAIDSAEVFDPISQLWSNVGSLPVKLSGYSVQYLSDGSPVISGGSIPGRRNQAGTPNTRSFIYNSVSKSFSAQ